MPSLVSRVFPIILIISFVHFSHESEKHFTWPSPLLSLPKDLKMGFASASYQIEGAWNVDGKGENIWDEFTHRPDSIVHNKSTGDVAADFYNHYKEDIALMKSLGVQTYRFSLSWARLLPTGYGNKVNPAGVEFYNNVINELLANNIEPLVTLYHWDLPLSLQVLGGWTNEKLVDYFADYADVAFTHFGDRVKHWITFNEPRESIVLGWGWGVLAPGVQGEGVPEYLAGHTLLKAHATAYHLYDKKFRPTQKGKIGIALNCNWAEPKTSSLADQITAQRYRDFYIGWFAHPILSREGDYPKVMRDFIDKKSKDEGYPQSRLPTFSPYWITKIRNTSDFLGINHYTTFFATDGAATPRGWDSDLGAVVSQDPNWPQAASSWLRSYPQGFRRMLAYVSRTYNRPEIYITENGFSDTGALEDDSRISFHNSYLREMLKAIYLDGVNIKKYTAWTFVDNMEWTAGYSEKFGVIHVDFNDPDRKRTPKKSAEYFRRIIENRKIDAKDE